MKKRVDNEINKYRFELNNDKVEIDLLLASATPEERADVEAYLALPETKVRTEIAVVLVFGIIRPVELDDYASEALSEAIDDAMAEAAEILGPIVRDRPAPADRPTPWEQKERTDQLFELLKEAARAKRWDRMVLLWLCLGRGRVTERKMRRVKKVAKELVESAQALREAVANEAKWKAMLKEGKP